MTIQPSQVQQNAQPAKGQGKSQVQTQERERESGEERSRDDPMSSSPDELAERGRTSPQPPQPDDADCNGGRDSPITMGVPHLLLEDQAEIGGRSGSQSEPEPEPTLVAKPVSRGKGGGSRAEDEMGQGNDRTFVRSRSGSLSEPLFFPESNEERNDTTGRVDKEKNGGAASEQDGAECASPRRIATIATSSATSTSTSTSTTHPAHSSTSIRDKPRSVQTVLNTHGAIWNLRKDGDVGVHPGSERKRARLSSEGDRMQVKKSLRSTLSQFLGGGSKALPDEVEESEGASESHSGRDRDRGVQEGGDVSEEVDELDEEDEGEEHLGKGGKKRPRTGSNSSQVTMVVPSDDEEAMDVDEPRSTISKPSRTAASSIPQTSTGGVINQAEDVGNLSEDGWAFTSTLVGTYVPPAGKTVEPSSNVDTDFVTLRVNLISIGTHYLDMYNHLSAISQSTSTSPVPPPSSTFRSAASSANLETAAENTVASAALSRIISKADFEHMVVVGQFNLGFIIVRNRSDTPQGGEGGTMDDLFIVDQHAADEKWNFETLQEKTVIASQKLFRCASRPGVGLF